MPNRRYHAVAHRLPRLPRELVHQVLDDLSIAKILELICNHEIPYVEECVSSHIQLGKFLPQNLLSEIKEYFTLYLRICSTHRTDPHPHIKDLEKDAPYFLSLEKPFDFVSCIKSAVLVEMKKYEPCFPALRYSSTEPIPDSVFWDTRSASALSHIYSIISSAEINMNTIKKAQLSKMADLLEHYPTLLRTCCEKDQSIRLNTKHRVDHLRLQASRMVRQQYVARSIFGHSQFYLVPYDGVLRVFLKVLHRYPPLDLGPNFNNRDQWKSRPRKTVPHRYPNVLEFVLEGLPRSFPHTPNQLESELIPRVIHTKYSLSDYKGCGGSNQPAFHVLPDYPKPGCTRKWKELLPLAEKEFEWLEAFLMICDYMSEMQEEWTTGQTISQYWKTHVAVG